MSDFFLWPTKKQGETLIKRFPLSKNRHHKPTSQAFLKSHFESPPQTLLTTLENRELKSLKNLSFSFISGACTNFNDKLVYLCFSSVDGYESKRCRYSNHPEGNFTEISTSNHDHMRTSIASSDSKLKCLSDNFQCQ